MTYYVIKAVFATVAFPVMLLVLYFRYHTLRYKFDAEGIRMSWGILFRREIMLNYSRIQDIHLRSTLREIADELRAIRTLIEEQRLHD